jgi:hypothetical protein
LPTPPHHAMAFCAPHTHPFLPTAMAFVPFCFVLDGFIAILCLGRAASSVHKINFACHLSCTPKFYTAIALRRVYSCTATLTGEFGKKTTIALTTPTSMVGGSLL